MKNDEKKVDLGKFKLKKVGGYTDIFGLIKITPILMVRSFLTSLQFRRV